MRHFYACACAIAFPTHTYLTFFAHSIATFPTTLLLARAFMHKTPFAFASLSDSSLSMFIFGSLPPTGMRSSSAGATHPTAACGSLPCQHYRSTVPHSTCWFMSRFYGGTFCHLFTQKGTLLLYAFDPHLFSLCLQLPLPSLRMRAHCSWRRDTRMAARDRWRARRVCGVSLYASAFFYMNNDAARTFCCATARRDTADIQPAFPAAEKKTTFSGRTGRA